MDYKLITFLLFFTASVAAQNKVSGVITSEENRPLNKVQVLNDSGTVLATSNTKGFYEFTTAKKQINVIFYADNFEIKQQLIKFSNTTNTLNIQLNSYSEQLSEIEIKAKKKKIFELKRLKDVEGTAIYAGKKTEVVLVNQATAALASNNARQIYSQVAGLNIFQNDDAGLQLNIGGRGLDPNRTSNFNTRQNGYDISADVLGYPESYYTPPAEALEEIQVVRGAASLQYGTQFGGLVNFVIKKPNANKPIEFITRNTIGSNGLYTNFTSIGGTKDKLSYYGYFNYKQGDGFRPNSQFDSKNAFVHLGYDFSSKTSLEAEFTYLKYLAQQAGGLTDNMFANNAFQSNRARNWFQVDWFLYNIKLAHRFSDKTNFTFNFFGLDASRKAVGYRSRRPDEADPLGARELLIGDFSNYGFEARLLSEYNFFGKKATYLLGSKFYKANNADFQGAGTDGVDANFSSAADQFPNYRVSGSFKNPNLNLAVFGENIFYVSDKLSITPGFRFEYIKTESEGSSSLINFDGAGNPIGSTPNNVDDVNERAFVLLGIGGSFKPNNSTEIYANISQNYRSITFSDVNIINPSNAVDQSLTDEEGFTADLGIRGKINNWLSYDFGTFGLFYNRRIGFLNTRIPPVNNQGQLRTNIGNARILGLESLFDINLKRILKINNDFNFNYFINTSVTNSEYTSAITTGILGNTVEFVPELNLKTGIRFGYKDFSSSLQYTYLSQQFTDASNSVTPDPGGIIGLIPEYSVLDFSTSYKYKMFKLEAGVNNLLNESYFTRRATGYPGPGIIPSSPRNYYVTLEIKL